MPQGKVIAIKPMALASAQQLMNVNLSETAATSNPANVGANKQVLYLIGKFQGRGLLHEKIEEVVSYDGTDGEFALGERVKFKVNQGKQKSVNVFEAYEVERHGIKLFFDSVNIISAVTLLASALLIFGATFGKEK